jgi:hypothetical protein
MRKEDITIGQDITIVSKGIRHNTFSEGTWIDETQLGATSFLEVTKVGVKYVYGKHFHFEDGKREVCYWEDKINPEEVLLFNGVRQDLEETYNKKRLERQAYEKQREDAHREIDREMHDLMRAKQEEWDKANPRPKPLDLTALPYT